ncbi:hypothetical protein ZIOFF_051291 [Zingiber officinale]|uniref:Uncharacterized protein n=1 Tax=Zingiber officinale TaxID=94328 RepID=A0A8J5KQX7_ZINOF|nr:hypothetical protein ZIOFF_051291 [Zingiber officinale]
MGKVYIFTYRTQRNPRVIVSSWSFTKRLPCFGLQVINGDHDLVVPFSGTEQWIKSLNYSIVEDWGSWYVGGQVTGYIETYSNNLTFATVKIS